MNREIALNEIFAEQKREVRFITRTFKKTEGENEGAFCGKIGIREGYPRELIDAIVQWYPNRKEIFDEQRKQRAYKIGGGRDIVYQTIAIDGRTFALIFKIQSKLLLRFNYDLYKELRSSATSEDFITDVKEDVLGIKAVASVTNELQMNRLAAQKFKEQYGEDLPIDVPVGYAVDAEKNGDVVTFFEALGVAGETVFGADEISDARKRGKISKELADTFRKQSGHFAQTLRSRLEAIGIYPADLTITSEGVVNVVATGEMTDPKTWKFYLIDAECWFDTKKSPC